jgi:predicted lipid carrier protein YhbT
MATVEQCRQALADVAARMAADPEAGARVNLDRSIACEIRDLGVTFTGRLRDGGIADLKQGEDPEAQIRLSLNGDDLLALVAGSLHFAGAWASGRLSVRASFGDLLKLRKLM